MAQLTFVIQVPNAVNAVVDFTDYHGWVQFLPDENGALTIPNPVTRTVFAQQTVAGFIKESIKAQRSRKASESARLAEIANVDAMGIQ